MGISDVEFQAPRFLPSPMRFSIDEELKNQLLWLMNSRKRLFKTIINAIEIFFQSYYNSPAVSHNARILLQTQSFEILLDLKNREDFKDKIEKYCSYPNERKYHYSYESKSGRKKGHRTLKGIWADRFYTLRNHIIHGDVVKSKDFLFKQQPHFHIALLFFILCIKELINEVRQTIGKNKIFYDSIKWEKWRDELKNIDRWGFVYEKDEWRQTLTRSKKGRKLLEHLL